MQQNFRTSHQGIAALALCKGYEIQQVMKANDKDGHERFFVVLNMDREVGRIIGNEYFNDATCNVKEFYDHLGTVRRSVNEFRNSQ